MDYTKIRPLIYCDRQDISEFGIYDDNDSKVNPFLYDRLKKVGYLHPSHEYANSEMLRIFNDVYFILTAFFMDERPLANYAFYQRIANPNNGSDILSKNRPFVETCMLYVILNRFNGTEWFRQKKTHSEFFEVIRDEVYNHMRDMAVILAQLQGAENIAYTITGECESKRFIMNVKEDFPPRDIQEVIDSGESLKDCLYAGKNISEAVNILCKNKEQKLKLIDRLLEAEKEHYGVMDTTISVAYRSLYELKAELKGVSLPEKLPFERVIDAMGPPMVSTPQFVSRASDREDDEDDDIQEQISELQDQIKKQKKDYDDMLLELLTDICEKNEEYAKEFLKRVRESSDQEIPGIVVQFKNAGKIASNKSNHSIWIVLHSAKLYKTTESNFNIALKKRS